MIHEFSRPFSEVWKALTPVERQIYRHLVEGMNDKEIAEAIGNTVSFVRKALSTGIYKKGELRDRSQAIVFYYKSGGEKWAKTS